MVVREVLPRDAIPSIDEPRFGRSFDGDSSDKLIVVEGEIVRSYPVRILHFHEIVHDTRQVGG